MSNNNQVNAQYLKEFGKKLYNTGAINIIAIASSFLSIFGIVSTFITFLAWISMLMAINEIKKSNEIMNNGLLNEFVSKSNAGVIFILLSKIIGILYSFLGPQYTYEQIMNNPMIALDSAIGSLISIAFTYIGWIFLFVAWGKFYNFLEMNLHHLPSHIQQEALSGAKNLKSSYLMYLLSFLIIPLFIGFIQYFIGIFRLGGTLKEMKINFEETYYSNISSFKGAPEPKLNAQNYGSNIYGNNNSQFNNSYNTYDRNYGVPAPMGSNPSRKIISTNSQSKNAPKFCRNCGANLEPNAIFCPACGSNVNNF